MRTSRTRAAVHRTPTRCCKSCLRDGVRPRLVVFNVNQKEFNPLDSAYRQLHPSVEPLAWSALDRSERASLKPTQSSGSDQALQRIVESTWQLYGMRNDLREWLFGDVDAVHVARGAIERVSGTAARRRAAHRPTAEAFEGTYDLTPLNASDVSFRFLTLVADLLHRNQIPALAILTPTNHVLLHQYIDTPEYAANLRASTILLRSRGIEVLNLDDAFPGTDFIDNDHLNAAGNRASWRRCCARHFSDLQYVAVRSLCRCHDRSLLGRSANGPSPVLPRCRRDRVLRVGGSRIHRSHSGIGARDVRNRNRAASDERPR
jgi:hypothetical protein